MLVAGLLARNARAPRLKVKPWGDRLAPGSRVVTEYLTPPGSWNTSPARFNVVDTLHH